MIPSPQKRYYEKIKRNVKQASAKSLSPRRRERKG